MNSFIKASFYILVLWALQVIVGILMLNLLNFALGVFGIDEVLKRDVFSAGMLMVAWGYPYFISYAIYSFFIAAFTRSNYKIRDNIFLIIAALCLIFLVPIPIVAIFETMPVTAVQFIIATILGFSSAPIVNYFITNYQKKKKG